MEIVRERLEREFDLDLLVTAPNVAYRVKPPHGDWREVHTPADMPNELEEVEEPYIKASIIVPKEFVGAVMELNNDRRGRFDHMEYLSEERVHMTYDLPLAEIVLDYYDQLKSRTRGYASFDYDVTGFRPGKLVRVDVLVAGEPVDALSLVVHRDSAYERGRSLVDRLREEIPRQHFDVAIQAAIGSRVIARETVKAKRKDVLAKCYGGGISRKRKLLERQKAGKKRMKQVGVNGRGPPGGVSRRPQPRRREADMTAASAISTCTSRSARTVAAIATSSPPSANATSTSRTSTPCSASSPWREDCCRRLSRPSSSAAEPRPSPSRARSSGCCARYRGRRKRRSRRIPRP